MKRVSVMDSGADDRRTNFIFAIILPFALLIPTAALAQSSFSGSLKNISITDAAGTNAPPDAAFTYSINGTTVTFDASASTDSDGSIAEYRWNFGDGSTGSGANVSHTYSSESSFPVTLTIVDNLGAVSLQQEAVSLVTTVSTYINFQPAGAPVPSGYQADSGGLFDASKGYGWVLLPTGTDTFDRNLSVSPDQAYDTVLIMPTYDGKWELAVANGTYSVTICMGDPLYPQGVVAAQAEGVSVINGTLSDTDIWLVKTVDVTVADGKLTVTFAGGGAKRRLCWLSVVQK